MKGLRALALLLLSAACSQPRLELSPAADAGIPRLVIDTRLPAEFALGHDPGALNLQWDWGQLDARLEAYVPERSTPLAIRATSADEAALAAGLLDSRGYEDVSLPTGESLDATLRTMTARELAAELRADAPPVVLDVREPWEQALRAIPGAVLLDPDEAPQVLDELEPEASYAVICERGYRSSQLASWMQRAGFDATNVIDGMRGWRALSEDERPPTK